jgi:NAD(P)-dependent dehydrogenase (short-subunit alcohol dehydrogenase family)
VKGRTVVITGASGGIGLEAAVAIARMGGRVALVSRPGQKASRAFDEVRARSQSTDVDLHTCDLSSMTDVRRLAGEIRERYPRLDVLINNAGTVNQTRRITADGFELTFAVNHLSHFVLTTLLLDHLMASAPSRVVHVSSAAHRGGDLDFDNLHYEHGGFSILKSYSRSKLANVLFSNELARRLNGSGVTSSSVHPGGVVTNIWNRTPWWVQPLLVFARPFMLSAEEGAARVVMVATSSEVEGHTGGYYERNKLVETSPEGSDRQLAMKLWEASEAMTALRS